MSHVLDEKKTIPALASLFAYCVDFRGALAATRIAFGTLPRAILDVLTGLGEEEAYLAEELQILESWFLFSGLDEIDPRPDVVDPAVLRDYAGSHVVPKAWSDYMTWTKLHKINRAFANRWPGPIQFWMSGDSNYPGFTVSGLASGAWLISTKTSRRRTVVSHRV
jgi:hypothetical protein